jgi:predicted DNA-binding transcriptional regulator YafY
MTQLAAYVAAKREGCTKQDIEESVPAYRGLDESALEKALQRDRAILRESLGIDIEYLDTDHRYRIRPPFFTAAERNALITAAALVDVDGAGDDHLPGELGTAVSQDRAQVVVQVHSLVVDLRDAIAERRSVQLRYNGRVRTFDPYVIGMWKNRWYVVGDEHDAGRRKFRLDKIERIEGETAIRTVGEAGAYAIPGQLDPEAELSMDPNVWGDDPPLTARLRVARGQAPRFLSEFIADVVAVDREHVELDVEVRDYESFVIRLLGFGRLVQLIGPPPLVAMLHDWLRAQAGTG